MGEWRAYVAGARNPHEGANALHGSCARRIELIAIGEEALDCLLELCSVTGVCVLHVVQEGVVAVAAWFCRPFLGQEGAAGYKSLQGRREYKERREKREMHLGGLDGELRFCREDAAA
jgi:hypothetical protein